MFERFTDRARRVLVLAQEEARLFNHNYIGTDHIVISLLNEDEGVAAQVLKEAGVDLKTLRDSVTPGEPGDRKGSPPFTHRAKKVLELSLREALQLGHNYIGTEHMLLGIMREGDPVTDDSNEAVKMLVGQGKDLSFIRSEVIKKLTGYAGEKEPPLPKRGMVNITLTPRETADLLTFINNFRSVAKIDANHPLTMLSRKLK